VPFAGLPEKVVLMVVDKLLVALEVKLQPQKVVISVSDPARSWLAKKGYDPMFGARPMARTIQQEIETVLADEVFLENFRMEARSISVLKTTNCTLSTFDFLSGSGLHSQNMELQFPSIQL
jgi:ATP-dependent Clp protease ATP-binding subunit ClpA